MSLILYVIRSKKDKSLYFKTGQYGGWTDNIKKANKWSYITGPSQVIAKTLGKDHAEIVSIEGHFRQGEYHPIYMIRHKVTGEYITGKMMRRRGVLFTKRFVVAGSWCNLAYAKTFIRSRGVFRKEELRINPDELEIIEMTVFVPKRGDT